jgi:hypothetical protein
MFRRLLIVQLALVLCASAQRFASSSLRVDPGQVTAIYGPPLPASVVTGAPYSADQLQEYTPTSPGDLVPARITIVGHYARDSQGRTRTSLAMKPAPYWLTEIFDPVAGAAFLLDEDAKIAHRMPVQPAPESNQPAPPSTTESLGNRLIEGVLAEGARRVFRVLTFETWTSPELKIELVSKSSNGYSSRLINLSRSEPDPALFRPPADYHVVDEPAPFRMTIRTR